MKVELGQLPDSPARWFAAGCSFLTEPQAMPFGRSSWTSLLVPSALLPLAKEA